MNSNPLPVYDVHCHVLPDLDDGPPDDSAAAAMLRMAADRGITAMVVTPHSQDVLARGGLDVLQHRLEHARALLKSESIGLALYMGMEVHLLPDVPELLRARDLVPLNGSRYVLIEFDFAQWANYTDDVLFQIQLDGRVPLLAHVERIGPLQEHPERLEAFVERGAYCQITAGSLLGGFGLAAKRTAELLLERGLVHVVASDAHSTTGNRQPLLLEAEPRLRDLVGEDAARALLYTNPQSVARDEALVHFEPRPKRRWRWFFRK